MIDTLSQAAIIFAATSRAVLASPRPPAPYPGGCNQDPPAAGEMSTTQVTTTERSRKKRRRTNESSVINVSTSWNSTSTRLITTVVSTDKNFKPRRAGPRAGTRTKIAPLLI